MPDPLPQVRSDKFQHLPVHLIGITTSLCAQRLKETAMMANHLTRFRPFARFFNELLRAIDQHIFRCRRMAHDVVLSFILKYS
jgi:hypothetical protein